VLIRLSPPGRELLLQSPRLDVAFGGAEANVAVGLAQLGHAARMVSILPDDALGQAALRELRRWGVDTGGLRFGPGRMGLYFATAGAGRRSGEVLYDRAHSAFCAADPALIDWTAELAGADWLHLSGVTPATGASGAAAALRAAQSAIEMGVKVAFDGNYRARLWADRADEAPAILRGLLACADLAVVTDRDLALALGRDFGGADALARRAQAAEAAFEALPRLNMIASLLRDARDAEAHELAAVLHTRRGLVLTEAVAIGAVVDRIGAGDAFVAGLIHGLLSSLGEEAALASGHRCAVLKHGVPGDFSLATRADLAAFDEAWTDIRR
jgi:2-dehydro-3-deoxygluconokinase